MNILLGSAAMVAAAAIFYFTIRRLDGSDWPVLFLLVLWVGWLAVVLSDLGRASCSRVGVLMERETYFDASAGCFIVVDGQLVKVPR
jgi:hypothetical protein